MAAGYEVHLNFSPVIYYEGWLEDYAALFDQVADSITPRTRAQLRAEVIFLTHNDQLHEVNLRWHPRAEGLLWVPELQEAKTSETGGRNVRYRHGLKGELVAEFCACSGRSCRNARFATPSDPPPPPGHRQTIPKPAPQGVQDQVVHIGDPPPQPSLGQLDQQAGHERGQPGPERSTSPSAGGRSATKLRAASSPPRCRGC